MADLDRLVRFALAAVKRSVHFERIGVADGAQTAPERGRHAAIVGIFYDTFQRAIFNPDGSRDVGTLSTPVRNSAGAIVGYLANEPTARYVQAGVGSFPTAQRNSLRAPGIENVDLLINKNFSLGAQRRLQFQAQIFNLFNQPQFTAVNLLAVDPGLGLNYSFVGSAGFNDIERAGGTGGARVVQLVLKVLF